MNVRMHFQLILKGCFDKINPQSIRRKSSRVQPPSQISLPSFESYVGKTHKSDFEGFPNFKVPLKVFLHSCGSCQGKTYKCGVTRKAKQKRREALDSETSKASIWEQLLLMVASFGVSFVVFQHPWPLRNRFCIDLANLLHNLKAKLASRRV